jgi:hypothetical protein
LDRSGGWSWLNIFYGVEWIFFASFALYFWWKLVEDDYVRTKESHKDSAKVRK